MNFQPIDWASLFVPTLHPLELLIRGSATYLSLFIILRIFRREAGTIGLADLLLIVLIADAAQNAMGRDYQSITDGILLVGVIVFWNYLLDWLAFRFPSLEWLIKPSPLPLIRDGKLLRHNMRKEMITIDELMSQLREQGVDRVEDVKTCCLETDGRISVVRADDKEQSGNQQQKRPV